MIRCLRSVVLATATILLSSVLLHAHSIAPPADPGELALRSEGIFLALAGESQVVEGPAMYYTITPLQVMDSIKAEPRTGDVVEVVSLGGAMEDHGYVVPGSPVFEQGGVYLLFGDRDDLGRWRSVLMADSVMKRRLTQDGAIMLEAIMTPHRHPHYAADGTFVEQLLPAVYEGEFLDHLREIVAGERGWTPSMVRVPLDLLPAAPKAPPAGCSYVIDAGRRLRWTTFDTGGTLNYRADSGGDPGVSGTQEFTAVQNALNFWNIGTTNIDVNYAGTSSSDLGCSDIPGSQNAVLFDDPCDEMGSLSGCVGTLGYGGGVWVGTHSFDGATWNSLARGFAVMNDGAICVGLSDYTEAIGHELGHSLGFDHHNDSGAMMWNTCEGQTCNAINSTDIECAEYAYPIPTPTDTPTITNTPTITPTPSNTRTNTPTGDVPTNTNTPATSVTNTNTPTPTPTPTNDGSPIVAPTKTNTPINTNTPTNTNTGTPATPTRTDTPTRTFTPTPPPDATPTPVPPPELITVPVAAHIDGVGGTPWRSDLAATNPGEETMALLLTYQPIEGPIRTKNLVLGPHETVLFEDVIEEYFGAGDGRGSVRVDVVTKSSNEPAVLSRIFAEQVFGNFGQGMPAVKIDGSGTYYLAGLLHDDAYRSNIAVTAAENGGSNVAATFSLYRGGDGLVASDVTKFLTPGEQKQWTIQKLFKDMAQPGVPMTVKVELSGDSVTYASLVDQVSTDAVTYLGKKPAYAWFVPVVSHNPGVEGTFWSSTVGLANPGTAMALVDLEYFPENVDNSSGGIKFSGIELGPGQTLNLEDPVLELFEIDDGKGVLTVASTQPIVVVSRVFTTVLDPGGTTGHGVRTVGIDALNHEETVLPGIRMLDGFRTNIGVVVGAKWTQCIFALRDADGTVIREQARWIKPRSFRQWSITGLFGNDVPLPDPTGSVTVTAGAEFFAYLVVLDGSSQDPAFLLPLR